MAIEVPQNEEIYGKRKNVGVKRDGSSIPRRRTKKKSIDIKERERRKVV